MKKYWKVEDQRTLSDTSRTGGGARGLAVSVLVGVLTLGTVTSASAVGPYEVPEDGLSFDANDTVETNPCTTGYGNAEVNAETDEINFLIKDDSVTYKNVAVISGQAIDAKVTVVEVVGMYERTPPTTVAPSLDRLDKCDIDSASALLEVAADNDTVGADGEARVDFTIDFYLPGTITPVTLTNLKMNVEDIDSQQYLDVDVVSGVSTRLATSRAADDVQEYQNAETIALIAGPSPAITLGSTQRRFAASGSSSSGDSQTEQDKHVVEVTYSSVNTISFSLGSYDNGLMSFDIDFAGFSFTTPAPDSASGSVAVVSEPAIHLAIDPMTGAPTRTATALMEGQGLKPSTPYSLRLGPGGQVLKEGVVSSGGRFSHDVVLPVDLPAGRYFVELQAVGADGSSPVLSQYFTVGSGGIVIAVEPSGPGAGSFATLANTGPGMSAVGLGIGAIGLLALGVGSLLFSRRRWDVSPGR